VELESAGFTSEQVQDMMGGPEAYQQALSIANKVDKELKWLEAPPMHPKRALIVARPKRRNLNEPKACHWAAWDDDFEPEDLDT
jgi:hypothetical protein